MPRKKSQPDPRVLADLTRRGIDLIEAARQILAYREELTEQELANPVYAGMLGGDFEATPSGNPEAPVAIQTRTKIRAEMIDRLMSYCFPRLKSTEEKREITGGVTVIVRSFGDAPPAKMLPPTKAAAVVDVQTLPEVPKSPSQAGGAALPVHGAPPAMPAATPPAALSSCGGAGATCDPPAQPPDLASGDVASSPLADAGDPPGRMNSEPSPSAPRVRTRKV